ncbi:hypothetical protein CRYUN_Cryun08bG0074300 [Craigia yunnanensis]
MVRNKQAVLNKYVRGWPKEEEFRLNWSKTECGIPKGTVGVLLKNLYLACDTYESSHVPQPYLSSRNHSPKLLPILRYDVARVIQSTHPDFKEGDHVWGLTRWEEYNIIHNHQNLNKIPCTDVPFLYYLGVLIMPGIVAYVGFFNLCCLKKEETVYVSTAAEGVGQLVGQFAKMMGWYIVGSVRTKEKDKFEFSDTFNYKEEPDLGAALKRYFPEGIDIYFDNVGGRMLDEVLLHMKLHGRIAACGMISQYNLEEAEEIRNLFILIPKSVEIKGYAEIEFKHIYSEYLELAIKYLNEGSLKYVEEVADGLENAASAFVGIFHARNVGIYE